MDVQVPVERIRAAVAAARALPRDFVLVARADGVMNGIYGMDEALARVRAFDALLTRFSSSAKRCSSRSPVSVWPLAGSAAASSARLSLMLQ